MEFKTIDTFNYNLIYQAPVQKRKAGNPRTKRTGRKYIDLMCAFDIEATNDYTINQAFMYIWQMQVEDTTIIGRTWEEFILFLQKLADKLDEDNYLMIYVHNLSYEFSFLKGIYAFDEKEVFAIDMRKVLKCEMFEHFEFRCSYLLTNMNLATFTKKMGVTEKLSGEEFDYSIIRYPWTELTDKELEYCIIDVKGLVEALKVFFSIEKDTFYTIPVTSTGFVRRDVKKAMRHFNRYDLRKLQPDYEIFTLLREAFRGGNTHANRYYAGEIISNVRSYDRVSSYPDVQINELFPMTEFIEIVDPDINLVMRKIYKQKRACLLRVGFENIRLKDKLFGCPYIPKHKCFYLSNKHYNDNGRILQAEALEITLTDIDFKIILEQYDFESIWIDKFYHARYGRLPKPLRDEVKRYFRLKTDLKNSEGDELFYFMAKQKLNSIYGLTVQNNIRDDIVFRDGEFKIDSVDYEEELEKYNKRAFLSYAWGVWTTAHARYQLEVAIRKVGDRFIYCDTDSVKYVDDKSIEFGTYNEERKERSENNGGTADDRKGNTHYLGIYESEGLYKSFVTLGAKKYAYVDEDDDLHITIAGVGKKKGAKELKKIENFREGFIFKDAGGTESVYNDHPDIGTIKIGENELEITSNVLIRPSTYTLGITNDYERILSHPAIWLDEEIFQNNLEKSVDNQ